MTPVKPHPPQDANEEIVTLIETLRSTERRLEELTGGEVDTVADRDGRTFVLRHIRERLRHNDAVRQDTILDALPAQIAVLDSLGRIVAVNKPWQQFVDANTPQFEGMGIGASYLDTCDNALGDVADSVQKSAAGIRAIQQGAADHFSLEYSWNTPTRQYWFLLTASPLTDELPNGVVVMRLDITERKLAERDARESERDAIASRADTVAVRDIAARLQAILDTVVDGVITIDTHGNVETLNPAAERIFGYAASEVIGHNVSMLMPKPFKGDSEAHIIRTGHEVMGLRKDTSTFPLELSISDMMLGNECHYTWLVRDITGRKAAEQEVAAARTEAERANAAKKTFLANMSHEIRTPMNGVIGMIEVLQQSNLNRPQMEMANIIRESSFALLDVINNILDFSKIEAGKLDIINLPTCIADVVEKVCEVLDSLAASKNVELTLFTDPAIPGQVTGDPGRLRQILINLASNAIKFSSATPRPGRVSVRALLVESNAEEVRLEFQVADNGIGLDEDDMARIFTPFVQADTSITRKYGGTGLGLVISRQLADMMGGDIRVSSEPGVGSLFSVNLPFALPPGQTNTGHQPGLLVGLSCLVLGHTAVIADDLAAYLTHSGAMVERTTDTAIASQWITSRPSGRPIVVIDSGIASPLLEELRATALAHAESDTHFVAIRRGQRRGLREEDNHLVSVDGNILNHRTLLDAVAIAAGLTPAPRKEVPDVAEVYPATLSGVAVRRRGGRILVAEDNEINQSVILHQLALLGYVADLAGDGREALARWHLGDHALLLTDLQMPNMDGYQLTAAIRRDEGDDQHLPIVALSANALKSEELRCRAEGMDDYLTKPVLLEHLQSMLEKWLPVTGKGDIAADIVEESPASQHFSVLDRRILPKLIGNDPALIARFFMDYQRSAHKAVEEIRAAIALGHWSASSKTAHKLKSSSRAIGALALGEVCQQLEQAARVGNADTSLVLAAELEVALAAVIDAMHL